MKKLLSVILFGIFLITACQKTCEHDWVNSTCLTPKTCKNCNLTEGTSLNHLYDDGICIRCGQKDPTYLTKKEQLMKFLQNDKKEELSILSKSLLENVNVEIKQKIQSIFEECFTKIDNTNTIDELKNTTNLYLNKIYELIPLANGSLDFSNFSDDEKQKILTLLNEYIFRTNLVGIPISPNYSLNLNYTSKETWIEFFGVNGTINQNLESEYWLVKPLLSNEYFIKGLNLCINKSEFNINYPLTVIDYQKYNFYEYNLDLARKYFAASLEEMIETGIYNPSSGKVELLIEIAFDSKNEQSEQIYQTLKNQIETAFNNQQVTNGLFELKVDVWYGELFGTIFPEKNYKGCFDISYGKISGGSIDFKPYKEYLLLSSSKELSNSMTLNFSLDTNSLDDSIVYNGYRFTYDALISLLIGPAKINNGKLVLSQ